jgi:hypothetical protein
MLEKYNKAKKGASNANKDEGEERGKKKAKSEVR